MTMIESRGFVGRRSAPIVSLPPGQYLTTDFPVLSAGPTPHVRLDQWEFTIDDGRTVLRRWSWKSFRDLQTENFTVDLHCVTRWSKLGTTWKGVPFDTLLAGMTIGASFALARSYGGYTSNLPMKDLMNKQAWIAFRFDGADLAPEHGGPARLLVRHLYLWKSAKWVRGITLLDHYEAWVLGTLWISQLRRPMAGAEIQGRLNWRIATAVALHDETATARTITFEVSDWLGHVPGQRVDIRVTATDGYSAVRQYSIASAPRADGLVDLSVQRLPDGEVSPYLTQEVVVGDRLELRGPIGEWFVWHDDQTEPIQLIAGGSGVVPLMAMIRSRAATRSSAPFRLLYSVRNPDSVWYGEELQALSSGDQSIGVTYLYTRSAPPYWPRRPGRIDPAVIAEATWSSKLSPTCYICGPTTFVDHAAELLMASGHPAERIRTERFGPTGDRHDLTSGERV